MCVCGLAVISMAWRGVACVGDFGVGALSSLTERVKVLRLTPVTVTKEVYIQ